MCAPPHAAVNASLRRTLCLFSTMIVGGLVPQLAGLSFLVRPLIFLMLGCAFLELSLDRLKPSWRHAAVALVGPALGLGVWALLRPLDPDWALAAFLLAATPSATACVVITQFLGGQPAFTAVGVLVTNLTAALTFPFLLPWLAGPVAPHLDVWPILQSTLLLIVVPLLLAQGIRWRWPALAQAVRTRPQIGFGFWIVVITLVTAQASHYLRSLPELPGRTLALLALLAACLCLLQFRLGRLLGGREHALECGQLLGQKNTVLAIAIALQCLGPLLALAPTLYILCHNLYNAWQLGRRSQRSGG